jgi:hypothetical protein
MQQWGKYLFVCGLLLMICGAILHFGGNRLGWLGKLPGDIHIKKENFSIYFPIATSVLLSILFTLLLWIWRKIQS